MASKLIHDRGRGPELAGTRITVYNLLPDFLDPTATEADICRLYELTPQQVAAARAYVLENADRVLAEHIEIETRMAAGNPPEVIEQAKQTHETLRRFREWLAERDHEEAHLANGSEPFPTFREWLSAQGSRLRNGS